MNVVALRSPIHSVILCTTARACARGDEGGGSCVAWGSGLQGFVGAMRCMGLTHTSELGGRHALHGTRSHIILELQGGVGGWRWLSGVRRCGSRKTYSHLTSLALSPPVRRGTACGPEQSGPHIASLNPCFVCQYQLLHCIRRPCSRSCPPSNTNITQSPHAATGSARNLVPTHLHHCEPQEK